MRKDNRIPWILPYQKRKKVSRKYRDTEKRIKEAKSESRWSDVIRLKYILRNIWWGIKRYK